MLRSPAALPNWWTSMAMVWVPTVSPAVGIGRLTAFFSAAPVISTGAKVENVMPDVRPPPLELLAAHSPRVGPDEAPVQVV